LWKRKQKHYRRNEIPKRKGAKQKLGKRKQDQLKANGVPERQGAKQNNEIMPQDISEETKTMKCQGLCKTGTWQPYQ
jgi:hypothetical protein